MNKQNPPPVGIGVITVFTVLLVLTLSVFSALTFTSAKADLALSQTNAETVRAYYAADAEAAALYTRFAAGTEPELYTEIDLSETQFLRLHLLREGGAVRIAAWQTVPKESTYDSWDDTLPLFTGELPE